MSKPEVAHDWAVHHASSLREGLGAWPMSTVHRMFGEFSSYPQELRAAILKAFTDIDVHGFEPGEVSS